MLGIIIFTIVIVLFLFFNQHLIYKSIYRNKPKILYRKYSHIKDGIYEGILLNEYEGTSKVQIVYFGEFARKLIIEKDDENLQIIRTRKNNPEYFL